MNCVETGWKTKLGLTLHVKKGKGPAACSGGIATRTKDVGENIKMSYLPSLRDSIHRVGTGTDSDVPGTWYRYQVLLPRTDRVVRDASKIDALSTKESSGKTFAIRESLFFFRETPVCRNPHDELGKRRPRLFGVVRRRSTLDSTRACAGGTCHNNPRRNSTLIPIGSIYGITNRCWGLKPTVKTGYTW
jgi:hypothetical protein